MNNGHWKTLMPAVALSIVTASAVHAQEFYAKPAASGGNDANNGQTWATAKATPQAAINAAGNNGRVIIGNGTFFLTSPLAMRPGGRVTCLPGAEITQANGANLASFIDFLANAAHGATLEQCTINGNRANNSDNKDRFLIRVDDANDVQILSNKLRNSVGYGVYIKNGVRPIIAGNTIENTYIAGIGILPDLTGKATAGRITNNVINGPIGQHAIKARSSDRNIISGNRIASAQLVSTVVNTSASSTANQYVIVASAGYNLNGAVAGQFITLDGGIEFYIISTSGSPVTALETRVASGTWPGPQSGKSAIIGDGDLINISNTAFNEVSRNEITGGGAGGIVVHNFDSTSVSSVSNVVGQNSVTGTAAACISVQAISSGSTVVAENVVTGNILIDCGLGRDAGEPGNRTAIGVFDAVPSRVTRTIVTNNVTKGYSESMLYNIYGKNVYPGQILAGDNSASGVVNAGIKDGISVALGTGWGDGASIVPGSEVTMGSSYRFTVASGTTNFSSNPLMTVTTRATTPDQPPIQNCKMATGTGILAPISGEHNAGAGSQVLVYRGTPIASSTYEIYCR